jgi:hypothetical protein
VDTTTTYEITMYPGEDGAAKLNRLRRENLLLKLIGLTVGRVEEFRDAWVEQTAAGDLRVAVYTMLGGDVSRRTVYRDQIEELQAHPLYLGDANDEFLPAYAAFYFRLPDGIPADIMAALDRAAVEVVDTSERWRVALERWQEAMKVEGLDDE